MAAFPEIALGERRRLAQARFHSDPLSVHIDAKVRSRLGLRPAARDRNINLMVFGAV
jgi:hypothetical protein